MRPASTLALILLNVGSVWALTPGVATPQGGWLNWRCVKFDACQIIRTNPAGEVVAASDEANTGVSPGDLTLSPDRSTLYTVGQHLTSLDATTLNTHWRVEEVKSLTSPSTPLAVSSDGQTLALATQPAGGIEFRRARDGTQRSAVLHPGPALAPDNWEAYYRTVTSLAYSPDGRTLAIGSRGGGIRLRELSSGRERRLSGGCGQTVPTAHHGGVHTLHWTDAQTLLSAANDGTIRRWDVSFGRSTGCQFLPGGPQKVVRLPGGRLAAVASTWVYLIDPLAFRVQATLGPHAGVIRDLALRGTQLETRDAVSERMWNLASGKQVTATGKVLANLNEGRFRVTVGPDMRVHIDSTGRSLNPVAAPPHTTEGRGYPVRWVIRVEGDRLLVEATSVVRVMTMETGEFTNTFSWNWRSGDFRGCVTTTPNGYEEFYSSDPLCPRAPARNPPS